MKERIRELFQEAIDYADKTHTYTPEEGFNIQTWDKIRFEKFAELIVRECANAIINDSRLNDVRSAANGCVRTINEHFGVEE